MSPVPGAYGRTLSLGEGDELVLGTSFTVLREVRNQPLEVGSPTTLGPRGPQGPPGPTVVVSVPALVDLQALTLVKVMGSGQARPASSLIAGDADATTGITTAAARAGEQVPIRTGGAIVTQTDLPVGPLYLGTDGFLTPDPNTGLFQLRVGYAQTPRLFVIRIDRAIVRA